MPKFAVLTIFVDDLGTAEDFYCNKLGFDVSYRMDGVLGLANDGVDIVIEKTDAPNQSAYREHAQAVMGIQTSNLEKTIEVLGNLGVKFVSKAPFDFPMGRLVTILDPSGNPIEILEFKKEE